MVYFTQQSRLTSISLALSIALFLVLDMSMLALNIKITREVSEDALVINLAGRQRMLSQRTSKLIFQIEPTQVDSANARMLTSQFIESYDLFTHTLQGFRQGGIVNDAELNRVRISPIDSVEGQNIVSNALAITVSLDSLVRDINDNGLTPQSLHELKGNLVAHGDVLMGMMNDLTVIIEKISREQSEHLRNIQLVTFVLALLNFIIIVRSFRTMTRQANKMVETLNELLQATNASLIIFDAEDKVIMANQSACSLFGFNAREIKDKQHDELFIEVEGHLIAQTAHDNEVFIELHERKIEQNGRWLTLSTILDVSHHMERQLTLSKLACRDSLTGLLNRTSLQVGLKSKIDHAEQFGERFACIFIDLNNFKHINDNHGHDSGDAVLVEFATRLKSTIRGNDYLYRYGGDEFILLIDLYENNQPLDKVAEKIHHCNKELIRLPDGSLVKVELSAGAAVFPDDALTLEDILTRADQLMYRSKKTNQFEFGLI